MQPPLPSARVLPARARGRAAERTTSPATNTPPQPAQLPTSLLLGEGAWAGSSFLFLFPLSPPLPSYLAFPSDPPQPSQAHSSSKPARRKFLPTPTLVFRAALLRLRQSLPLEGAPVQQHPGPFTSPPPPSPSRRPGPPRPPCPAVVNCLLGRPGAGLREWLRRSGIVIRPWGWRGRARSDGRGRAVWRAAPSARRTPSPGGANLSAQPLPSSLPPPRLYLLARGKRP